MQPNRTLSRLHLRVGLAVVFVFVLTGVYLRVGFPGLYEDDETLRYIYRANHIYILAAGLVHVALGLAVVRHTARWRRRLQLAGSGLLLLACVLLITAFFRETTVVAPGRPLTELGIIFLAIGVLGHLVASARRAASSASASPTPVATRSGSMSSSNR